MKRCFLLLFVMMSFSTSLRAENYGLNFWSGELDSEVASEVVELYNVGSETVASPSEFKLRKLLLPAVPIVLGSLTLYVTNVNEVDNSWSDNISRGHGKLTFDDYLQYSPVLIMYGLDAFGNIKPYHKIKQQTTILLMSTVTALTLVQGTKTIVARRRPDNTAKNSFPSGHTATAFLCAEMLHHEFGHHSPWISVAGYSIAAVTGYMRVYNERHYLADVIAGAGFGMLSARLAYWAAPYVNEWLWGSATGYDVDEFSAVVAPCALGNGVGVNLSVTF